MAPPGRHKGSSCQWKALKNGDMPPPGRHNGSRKRKVQKKGGNGQLPPGRHYGPSRKAQKKGENGQLQSQREAKGDRGKMRRGRLTFDRRCKPGSWRRPGPSPSRPGVSAGRVRVSRCGPGQSVRAFFAGAEDSDEPVPVEPVAERQAFRMCCDMSSTPTMCFTCPGATQVKSGATKVKSGTTGSKQAQRRSKEMQTRCDGAMT